MVGIRDNFDLLVQRLGRLVNVLEQKEFGAVVVDNDGQQTPNYDLSEPSEQNTANLYSSGPQRVNIVAAKEDNQEWLFLPLGLMAKTISIRTTDDVVVSFAQPNQDADLVKVRAPETKDSTDPDESPFTIGGSTPINTAFVWIKPAESATTDPLVEVLAYR